MSMSDSSTDIRKLIGYHDDEGERLRDFEPVPYAIRTPNNWKKDTSVLSPPNWLLLDHTVAVVWSLFSVFKPAKNLDIEDLKWAHEFLKEVRNAKGENPPDVKTCLTKIQDRLIGLYAQLTHPKEDKAIKNELRRPEENVPLERQKTTSIETSKVPKREVKTVKESLKGLKTDTNASRRSMVKETPPKEVKKSIIPPHRRVSAGPMKTVSVPVKRADTTKKDSKKEDEETKTENFFTDVFHRNRNNDRILGTNIAKKKPSATAYCDMSRDVLDGDADEEESDKEIIQSELEDGKFSLKLKKLIAGEELNNKEQAYRDLENEIQNLTKNPNISKDEVFNFMSKWREEEMKRLQNQLRRMNIIEECMKNIKEGFVPYINENLAQSLRSATNNSKKLSKPS